MTRMIVWATSPQCRFRKWGVPLQSLSSSCDGPAATTEKATGFLLRPQRKKKGKQPRWPDTLLATIWETGDQGGADQEARCVSHLPAHIHNLTDAEQRGPKVVQDLLRSANSRVTLDLYAHAGMQEKREAQSKVMRLVFNKGKALA